MSTERRLAAALRQGIQLAREMKAEGASDADRAEALERILRANWPETPPEDAWPWWARVPRCVLCDGYGLIIRQEINRLGCLVEVGTPCTCPKGARHEAAPAAAADFTAAGKTAKPSKGFSKW